tara:strand:- start:302 stop:538 length:237 start_codon:yes stop_codon:yes gene_type:complete
VISSSTFLTDYEVGDLVILLHSIEFARNYVHCGEIALVVEVYTQKKKTEIYDCRIKLKCGHELDVWYGEIHRLVGHPE